MMVFFNVEVVEMVICWVKYMVVILKVCSV